MSITVTPVESGFGAEVSGLDLRQPLNHDTYAAIEAALSKHGVIYFRNQPLTEAEQEAFIRWFGPPNALARQMNNARMKNPYFYDVSNVDEEGKIMMEDHERRLYLKANMFWHTDMSMRQPPARVTALNAIVLPEIDPPDTEFADMRAAWEALPPERQKTLESLRVVHSVYASRSKVGYTNFNEETRKLLPPTEHPLVRTHAGSGRKNLYIGAHASHIVDMDEAAGRALLEELTEFSTQPQFRYAHKWQPHDLLVWDDSCTLHRSTPFDDQKFRRELRWCSARELEAV
ncbi:Alpha-ketoglutarate-dependent 2,4-dichlorophenoxyacetate dioxygenase [Achromobacter veterisilvae]|uniref:Alpha-ketoglutarate-dependent 2,4-dichlorophenoxyacetate dioxygenase n=1 Tax=Achromobacter veterisilvae TaxID=2069367 RepID=A0A446CI78_9BURK|nr:TauD/TfdA family dioxygenase [Achromobacter veterisilvae]SSW67569.1 Alpha-ketoglutarate-dependent 2,4-dichlorophenoxyacetate dioxygenase [Achromobacter veterisilvae]